MKLISSVAIERFRSVRNESIESLGDFTAFAGQNNSGKSNVLRALNAFFKNQTDSGLPINFSQDFYRHDLKSRKKKEISIEVAFGLPASFKFRKGLEATKQLLGQSFKLRKTWSRDSHIPQYYLNGDSVQLNLEQRDQVEQFLSLISFRYIPNRVLPLDIIRNEHMALRNVLIRRLAKKAKSQEAVFRAISETSATLIKSLQSTVHEACPDIGSIRLATPLSWQDLIFAFGYKLKMNESEIDDIAQGSGIQSLLMLETLSLIDRDYFQKFGWKQAAIWAVEEPESSLHTSLEAKIATYLSKVASDPKSRLQILCTTHSDLILQCSDKNIFVAMESGKSQFEPCDRKTILEKTARRGVSRWTHPILQYPLEPVILVEGKYDCVFLEQAFKLLAPQKSLRVSYLEILQGNDVKGGIDELLKYLKMNIDVIKARSKEAPVIILLDWDSARKEQEFSKLIGPDDPCQILSWDEHESVNPKLGRAFHGIERHMSDRIIDEADAKAKVLGTKKDGSKTVNKDDYGKFKEAVFEVVRNGIADNDLIYAGVFLQNLMTRLVQVSS